jgi:spermidine synthase
LQQRLRPEGKIIINMLPRTDQEWRRVQQLLSCCGEVRSVQIAGYRNYLVWTEPKPVAKK